MDAAVKSEEILNSIISCIKKHGYPPTFDEIGEMNGFKSKATTSYHLHKMMDVGMIETDNPNSARAIRVPGYKFVKAKVMKKDAWEIVAMADRLIKTDFETTSPVERNIYKELLFKVIQEFLPLCNPKPPEAKKVIITSKEKLNMFLEDYQ